MGWRWGALLLLGMHGVLFAGDVGGNGGDGIRCTDTKALTETFELLDYFEAQRGSDRLTPALGDERHSFEEKIYIALKRLARLDARRAERYQEAADAFLAQVEWISSGPPLEDISDTGPVVIPEDCHLEQLAIRRKVFHPSIKPYLFDARLWDELTLDHRVGLVLHEIIYKEMYELGHRDSSKARRFNAVVSSDSLETMSRSDYRQLVASLFERAKDVSFTQNQYQFEVKGGHVWTMDLNSLLKQPAPQVQWELVNNRLPAWVSLDLNTGVIRGVPGRKDVGTHTFYLAAKKGDLGSIAEFTLVVRP